MKLTFQKTAVAVGLLSAFALPGAYAAGTASGTTISNTATVNYSVSGVAQTAIQSGGGTPTTFIVDRKVNLTVTSTNAPTVVPAQTNAVLTYTLQNNSNETLKFGLGALDAITGAVVQGANTDSDDTVASSIKIYKDAGLTQLVTSPNDLGALAADATVTLWVVADIKAASVHNAYIGVALTATAYEMDGTTVVAETAGANTAGVDTVWADVAGATDVNRDGKHSAYGAYHVVTASLTVSKTSTVVWDPFNGTSNPKAIPGAVVEYCIVVTNSGGQAAGSVVLTDGIPANTTYYATQPGSPGGAPTPGVTTGSGATCGTTPHSPTQGSFTSPTVTSTYTGNIPASSSVWTRFYITVN